MKKLYINGSSITSGWPLNRKSIIDLYHEHYNIEKWADGDSDDVMESEANRLVNWPTRLSKLLNILDSIVETPGRIIIMTTNKPEILDQALVRPGRIDICLQMMKADIEIIRQMFDHFYSYKKWVGNSEGKPDFYDTIAASKYSVTDINKRLSQAEIVQCYSESPIEFIENIAEKSLKLVI